MLSHLAIDTDMTKALPEEARTALINDIALERLGSPEDIAAVAFLASPAAGYHRRNPSERRHVHAVSKGAGIAPQVDLRRFCCNARPRRFPPLSHGHRL